MYMKELVWFYIILTAIIAVLVMLTMAGVIQP